MSRELVAARVLIAELEHVRSRLCDPGCTCDRAKAWAAYDAVRPDRARATSEPVGSVRASTIGPGEDPGPTAKAGRP